MNFIFSVLNIFSLISAALGFLAVPVFNAVPAKWLADYGVAPDEKLLGKRLKALPHGVLTAVLMSVLGVLLSIKYGVSVYSVCGVLIIWILVLTVISDIKYSIIPDQFVCILAVLALSFIINDFYIRWGLFHTFYLSPVLGAVIGGGVIFLMGFIGAKLLKKDEAMGFGDVKLFAAVGLLTGFPGVLLVLLMTIIISGVYFIVLILAKKLKANDRQPLGPYIAVSCVLYILFFREINWLIDAYLNLIRF